MHRILCVRDAERSHQHRRGSSRAQKGNEHYPCLQTRQPCLACVERGRRRGSQHHASNTCNPLGVGTIVAAFFRQVFLTRFCDKDEEELD